MFKDNGRLAPASREEMGNYNKGKFMECPSCGKSFIIVKAKFADVFCEHCGEKLLEGNFIFAGKAAGN